MTKTDTTKIACEPLGPSDGPSAGHQPAARDSVLKHEPLLNVAQVAEALNTSIKTVRRRIKWGDLPVIRDGRLVRVRPADLRSYIALRRCE